MHIPTIKMKIETLLYKALISKETLILNLKNGLSGFRNGE